MKKFRRFSSLLLPVVFIFLLNSCATYKTTNKPLPEAMAHAQEVVGLHYKGVSYELVGVNVTDDVLKATMFQPLSAPRESDKGGEKWKNGYSSHGRGPSDMYSENAGVPAAPPRSLSQYTVTIYVNPAEEIGISAETTWPLALEIPIDGVEKVEVREFDGATTFVKTLGGIALTLGVIGLIIAATKESCPFVYVHDGQEYQLLGEIYSGAIHPPLERHDYMALPSVPSDTLRLKLSNEVLEIQHTNLAELLAFEHEPGQRVMVDRHGSAQLVDDLEPPVAGNSLNGLDILDRVSHTDGETFLEGLNPEAADDQVMDGMILTFDRPEDADAMQLLVNARNTPWLDHVMGILFERMGDMFQPWLEAQKTGSSQAMRKWCLDQGLPLMVSVQTPDGWRFVDYLDLPGPIASRDAVMALDLAGLDGDKVTIKLECGYRFWEIDSVQAGFSSQAPAVGQRVNLNRAATNAGQDVAGLLFAEDDLYLDQPNVGDEAYLEFLLEPVTAGKDRSLVFHTKGHYDILRTPRGNPDAGFVASFRQPGRVAEFSRELFETLDARVGN